MVWSRNHVAERNNKIKSSKDRERKRERERESLPLSHTHYHTYVSEACGLLALTVGQELLALCHGSLWVIKSAGGKKNSQLAHQWSVSPNCTETRSSEAAIKNDHASLTLTSR